MEEIDWNEGSYTQADKVLILETQRRQHEGDNTPLVRWPQSTLSLLLTICSLLCTICSLLCTICSLLCTICSLLCTICSLLRTICSLLRTICSLLRTICSLLCIICLRKKGCGEEKTLGPLYPTQQRSDVNVTSN